MLLPVPASASAPPEKGLIGWRADGGVPIRGGLADTNDPLGLVRWTEGARRRGWVAFQVVGGFGVLGAVAVWMARNWEWELGWEGGEWWARWREQAAWF